MAKKSFPKHNKKSTKGNSENEQNVDSENASDTKNKSLKKCLILNRKQKPTACVQPQQSLQSNISSNATATVTTKPTISRTASAPKQENNLKNSSIYQGQPLINLSTIRPVSLAPHLCHLSYQPFTCPVINRNSVASRYVPSSIITYQTWDLPLPIVPVITPVQIYSQIVPVLPIQTFANVILPGASILPFNNLSLFKPEFRYSSQLSSIDYNLCAFPCDTSPYLSSKGSNLYESCKLKNTAQPHDTHTNRTVSESIEEINTPKRDPLEFYLRLPEDLFPKIKMLSLDPNPIIDVFCKVSDIHNYEPWLLDLEYGVPRTPVTRPIAIYDVQHNRIHCKNTPGAIHPGFENCSSEFKTVIMFYYDCIISAWYRGYTIMYVDVSVANYQSWLRPPMQAFGMCWP